MEINREYRSSVFAMLFNDRKELLTLYNAINGTAYTEEDRVISGLPFYGSSQTEDKVRGLCRGLRLLSYKLETRLPIWKTAFLLCDYI